MRRVVSRLLLAVAACGGCSSGTPVVEVAVDGAGLGEPVPPYTAPSTDWPAWRGPQGNGVSPAESAPTTWSETEHVVWRSEVPGRGHGSPVVVGDQIFLASALESQQQQLVVAFDRSNGEPKWRTVVHNGKFPSAGDVHPKGTHANGSVCCDDQHLFIAFLHDDSIVATALDFEGNIAWQQKLGAFDSKFGYAPSPLVHGSLVIFAADNQGGGYLAALHRRSGELVWRKARSRSSSYSSPVVAHVAGRDQLLISGGYEVCSYDPASGELLWSCAGTTDATCGTMVWKDDLVFASGGYPDRQTLAVRADGSAEVVWTNKVQNYEPSMLIAGDNLYAVTDNGVAYCWDADSGKEHWHQRLRGNFSASPVFCAGSIFASNDAGTTFVFSATDEGYEAIARNRLGEEAFATPTICDGKIFLRVAKRIDGKRQELLYCIGDGSSSRSQ